MGALKAGVVFFLPVFAVGWVLGLIWELWAVPRFGRMTGTLLEAGLMVIVMVISALWIIRRFDLPRRLGTTITMGLIAVGLLLPAEIAGVVWVRGLSLREYLASFVTAPGVVSLLMFLVFGAMPTLVGRLTAAVGQHNDCGEVEDLWETGHWDAGHPYRHRVWIRGRLPWWLINLGVANKGRDCEAVGAWHRWYKSTDEIDGCYHCEVTRRRISHRDATSGG
jgi:hypothetical protein